METRQLRYFVAVAEELSFSRAAERLNVSQPPLSMQIKALEEELGARLFDRTRRKVEITQAGLILLDHARKALGELRRGAELIGLSARGEAGLIRMGFTDSVPMLDMFPRLMRTFRDRYPEIRIELRHMSTAHQLQAVGSGDLDVGILRPPYHFQAAPGITVHRIWRDELMVFLPTSHPLASGRNAISLDDLAREAFVCIAPDVGCGMHEHVVTLCARAGFSPRVVQHTRELGAVLGLVAAGIGLAILPECYMRIGIPGVVNRPLAEPGAASELVLACKARNVPPTLRHFMDVALALPQIAS
ncbi:MAG TPA: LysR family transcriptional regulator [Acetobacteraceae bacterium]|nr:LysR family transcriptional regulator [Acetobacteraceae bacterium]